MIEGYGCPILWGVACGASLPELTLVHIILGMAAITVSWCIFIQEVFMAICTDQAGVLTGQLEWSR